MVRFIYTVKVIKKKKKKKVPDGKVKGNEELS